MIRSNTNTIHTGSITTSGHTLVQVISDPSVCGLFYHLLSTVFLNLSVKMDLYLLYWARSSRSGKLQKYAKLYSKYFLLL